MRQSVQFPMHVESENLIRGRNKFAIYGKHDAQREKVKAILTKHIVKMPEVVAGDSNRYIVTLCRMSAGFLDSEDNLTGAFKHVKDAVARWLGFKNDAHERLRWVYQQQECPKKFHGVRITIDDQSEGSERCIVLGESPPMLGAISEGCIRAPSLLVGAARPKRSQRQEQPATRLGEGREQQRLPFRKSFIACPWELPPDADEDDIVARELRDLANVERPPEQLQVKIPAAHVDRMLRRFGSNVRGLGPGSGPRLVFERVAHEDPAMGGNCWLYMPVENDVAQRT